MKNFLAIAVLVFILGFSYFKFKSEEDLLVSLDDPKSESGYLFKSLQQKNIFKDKIFLDVSGIGSEEKNELTHFLESLNYKRANLISFQQEIPDEMMLFLPPDLLKSKLSSSAVKSKADEIFSLLNLPGAGEWIKRISSDPLGLKLEWFKLISESSKNTQSNYGNGSDILIYESPRPMNFQVVGKAYTKIKELKNIHFIGADFFAYENYLAINRDAKLCTLLGLIFNLLICFIFIRHKRFILFAVAGTFISYITGIFALSLFFDRIYMVVIAFTSTFLGFNIEYLVHLSGIKNLREEGIWKGLTSAIGTTFIGFLFLFFSSSEIVRQMAVVSIGGMFGFLAFLFFYSDKLKAIDFKAFKWKMLSVSQSVLRVLMAVIAALLLIYPKPKLETGVSAFQYRSSTLSDEINYFKKLSPVDITKAWAVPVTDSPSTTYQQIVATAESKDIFSPLKFYQGLEIQEANRNFLSKNYENAVQQFNRELKNRGISLSIPANISIPKVLNEEEFLKNIENITQQKWYENFGGKNYLYIFSAEKLPNISSLAMSPEIYYSEFLTHISSQIVMLFVFSLIAMIFYLWFIHRNILVVATIFFPLALSALAYLIYFQFLGRGINLIEVMAFILVIGLALDYAAIAISTDYERKHLNKVLFTGLSAISSFGILIFASHPILKNLGTIATLGIAVSLISTLSMKFLVNMKKRRL